VGDGPTGWKRWAQVALAAAFINTSYGTLSYAFSVLVTDQAAGGDFGKGTVALGFGLALLVSGVASIGIGTVSDLIGSRAVMAGGSVVGAIGLVLLGMCQQTWQVLLVMTVVLGPAMAATFYEPVYVLMNRWFEAPERPKAYGVLTLLSGVSITIFTPLTQFLVSEMGWRPGVAVLGGILLVIGLAVPLLVGEPRVNRPEPGSVPPMTPRRFLSETWEGMLQTTRQFWAFSIAFFAGTMAFSGYAFHMISQLETRGFEPGPVAWAIGITGIISLPARLLLPALASRVSSSVMLALCLGGLGVAAIVASVANEWWEVWVYVGLFGVVFGAVYPLRTLVVSERFAGPYFGRVIGLSALMMALARAAGPAFIGCIGTDQASYQLGFQLSAGLLAVSAVVCWWAMRGPRPQAEVIVAPG
jgi:MFS family permease